MSHYNSANCPIKSIFDNMFNPGKKSLVIFFSIIYIIYIFKDFVNELLIFYLAKKKKTIDIFEKFIKILYL